jgi:hypothetical protein
LLRPKSGPRSPLREKPLALPTQHFPRGPSCFVRNPDRGRRCRRGRNLWHFPRGHFPRGTSHAPRRAPREKPLALPTREKPLALPTPAEKTLALPTTEKPLALPTAHFLRRTSYGSTSYGTSYGTSHGALPTALPTRADAFLLSLRAGGTGLNLAAATYVIHLDPWWNPAVEDQATDRAHRIGQDRLVTVIRMVARGTIEESVLTLHEEKRQLAASILDGADAAARLDGNDLLDLIRKGGVSGDDEEDAGEEGEPGSAEGAEA